MKTLKTLAVFSLILSTFHSTAQSVGINSTGVVPDQSALLDLNSTDRGFLITRADTLNIANPAFGLMTLSPIDTCLYLFNGSNWMGMGGGGCNCPSNCSNPPPEFFCDPDNVTQVVDVINPATGKTWMDRNLGASRAPTNINDVDAYGDLYQWGRCADGHQKRTSAKTTTLSPTNIAGHDEFIVPPTTPYDWLSVQNDVLWQGVNGLNNPCPAGYRLPTDVELSNELATWATANRAGAYGSPLKLTAGGYRNSTGAYAGDITKGGNDGDYWSSTVTGTNSRLLFFNPGSAQVTNWTGRAAGSSVRCIKD